MISAQVTGNLGAEPELKYLDDGTAVLELSIAVNGGKDDKPTWVRASWFGALAAKAGQDAWFAKGERVHFRGTLRQREYTTREGKAGVSLDMRVEGFEFVGKGEREEQPAPPRRQAPPAGRPAGRGPARPARPAPAEAPVDDADIPF